jgi:hypothetical protein
MKHPNGYLPKIKYWLDQLDSAMESKDSTKVEKAKESLRYFIGRQYASDPTHAINMFMMALECVEQKHNLSVTSK